MIYDEAYKIAIELIKDAEGFSEVTYRCTAGKLTQGYGRNLEALPLSAFEKSQLVNGKVSKEIASQWVDDELSKVWLKICGLDIFNEQNSVRKAVLLDMAYNMGYDGLMKFKNMFKALDNLDYTLASREMKDSAWYLQVGSRGRRNVLLMAKGIM